MLQTTVVEGTKTWKDDNATNRLKKVKVDLLQKGQVIRTQEVTEVSGLKYTLTKVVACDAKGKLYKNH